MTNPTFAELSARDKELWASCTQRGYITQDQENAMLRPWQSRGTFTNPASVANRENLKDNEIWK